MDGIFSLIISTVNDSLPDLGFISEKIGDKALKKGIKTTGKSLFSLLKDYSKQGSAGYDEQIEKIKKQPIVDRLNYLYGGDKTFTGRYGIDIIKVCIVIFFVM